MELTMQKNIKFEWFLTSNTCEFSQIFTFFSSTEEEREEKVNRIVNTRYKGKWYKCRLFDVTGKREMYNAECYNVLPVLQEIQHLIKDLPEEVLLEYTTTKIES